ncbi:helix-turn-helix domain-containing protein [Kineosporia sp. NBRC 101731]|uniref:PucR family transcriptional regulator n=1 Tax=Kineosporia sp. NBRC 101731 TaxID=3032199 RepID=UPI0024A5E4AA|nr:helix-turn-helix domain-containing protein [Kineosporia sp. NBRC 101731]GLY32584.1 PucR family transcriptional regulator [Kineosporia sp. NBRC 101731]
MSDRARASLARVLDDLGTTLLDLVHPVAERPQEIGGVVIHDRLDEPVLPPHALVLGVGLETEDDVVALLGRLGRERALALVVRAPVPAGPAVREAADRAGICLLGLSRGVPWAHLAALLRSLLAEGDVGADGPQSLGGLPAGDLFAVANAIAALMDAPVTIEDRSSRVLAFSGRQNEADASRVETVLGRQVPEPVRELLARRGVFRDLHRSHDPVLVDPVTFAGVVQLPRLAIVVRAGDEVLGSIWATVTGPLGEARIQAFGEAAKLVALHMLRVRAGADGQRRMRTDLLSTALTGGAGATDALGRLGLAGSPLLVLAVVGDDEQERLGDAFAMHLSAVHPRAVAATIGGVTYGLVPMRPDQVPGADERAARLARDFLDRVGERLGPVAAVGPVAPDLAGLVRARTATDRVLRVLRENPRGRRVAGLDEVQAESLLLELRDQVAARGDRPSGALLRLAEYDQTHGSFLVVTLRAWLDAFGDVIAAAASVPVHPNTFRYRLRRVTELGGIDLTDAEQRFALMLQLRVHRLPESGT